MYPLKFKPIYKERIWGGQKLQELFGRDLPEGRQIGESWELADLPEDKSEIVNGPFAGQTIDEVLDRYGKEITGKPDYSRPFPLLIKFLDAEEILSVQVHPDEAACRRMGKGQPKTECWYILDAQPDSFIYKGLREGTTKEQFALAVKNGTVEQFLRKAPVARGQCHFLPSGTCHAIGPGLVIAEIQQPSDTTYRVFDWNRVDPKTGKGRQLHIDDALESIHFDSGELPVRTSGRLVESSEFVVDKKHGHAGEETAIGRGKMKVIIVIAGKGSFADSQRVSFIKGDTLLIPFDYEGAMRFEEETEYLSVGI